jgi:Tannase and feruloyl esterase
MAQRFPADYDDIVSVVPAIQLLMIFEAFVHHEVPRLHGGLMPPAKVAMLAKFVADRCDALDELADGVVNNYLACPARTDLKELRCPDGADSGASCLCDALIAAVALVNGLSQPMATRSYRTSAGRTWCGGSRGGGAEFGR